MRAYMLEVDDMVFDGLLFVFFFFFFFLWIMILQTSNLLAAMTAEDIISNKAKRI